MNHFASEDDFSLGMEDENELNLTLLVRKLVNKCNIITILSSWAEHGGADAYYFKHAP